MLAVAQVEHLAQRVADLQDSADSHTDAHNERVAALQATIERLIADADRESDERVKELEANIQVLEQQVLADHHTSPHKITKIVCVKTSVLPELSVPSHVWGHA